MSMTIMNHKKVKRDYWMAPYVDAVIRSGARELNESQSGFLELCVLDRAEDLIRTRKLLKRLAQEERLPSELTDMIRGAKRDFLRRIETESHA